MSSCGQLLVLARPLEESIDIEYPACPEGQRIYSQRSKSIHRSLRLHDPCPLTEPSTVAHSQTHARHVQVALRKGSELTRCAPSPCAIDTFAFLHLVGIFTSHIKHPKQQRRRRQWRRWRWWRRRRRRRWQQQWQRQRQYTSDAYTSSITCMRDHY